MLRKIITSIAALTLFSASLFADAGSVSRVDTTAREIVVYVGGDSHTVREADVKLLDKDGNAAKLSDFTAGALIEVTLDAGKVTSIQLK